MILFWVIFYFCWSLSTKCYLLVSLLVSYWCWVSQWEEGKSLGTHSQTKKFYKKREAFVKLVHVQVHFGHWKQFSSAVGLHGFGVALDSTTTLWWLRTFFILKGFTVCPYFLPAIGTQENMKVDSKKEMFSPLVELVCFFLLLEFPWVLESLWQKKRFFPSLPKANKRKSITLKSLLGLLASQFQYLKLEWHLRFST